MIKTSLADIRALTLLPGGRRELPFLDSVAPPPRLGGCLAPRLSGIRIGAGHSAGLIQGARNEIYFRLHDWIGHRSRRRARARIRDQPPLPEARRRLQPARTGSRIRI